MQLYSELEIWRCDYIMRSLLFPNKLNQYCTKILMTLLQSDGDLDCRSLGHTAKGSILSLSTYCLYGSAFWPEFQEHLLPSILSVVVLFFISDLEATS